MARIYVSSSYGDLKDHREQVYRALRELGHDVVAMEDYVATDQRPLVRSLADVASCDLYVGIVAHRYGHVPDRGNPAHRSITELEYRHAKAQGIPRLMFLLDPGVPWPTSWVDAYTGEGNHGTRIRVFREELGRDPSVRFFSTAEELARTVSAAVTNQLATDGTAPPAPGGLDAGRVRLMLVYAREDQRLVRQLAEQVAVLEYEGLAAVVHTPVGHQPPAGAETADAIRDVDVVLLLLSTDLIATGYLEREQFQRLMERHEYKQLQLMPVLLRSLSVRSLPHGLSVIPSLPGQGQSVTDSPSREAVFAQMVDAVRSACLEIAARRRRGSERARPPRPGRPHYQLVHVFKESGVPSVTFVEPDDFYQLKLALEQPGRGVVIEGPSGVGKTTALKRAIKELGTGLPQKFEMLSARDPEQVARIATLRAWHRGPVAVDDVHRLDPAIRLELVDYLKLLADTEPADRKLVIVGIPGTRQQLVQLAFDLATRVDVLSLGTVDDDKVQQMIEKGEAALNIDLVGKSEIVRAAAGSLLIAQKLCQQVVALAGIRGTQTTLTPVSSDLPRAMKAVMDQMAAKFGGLVHSFAALDGPRDRFCIELLMELAAAKDGTLPLWQLRDRRPDLAPGINRFVTDRLMRRLASQHAHYDQHILYDHQSATLVIDDPQLTFYLRQLGAEQLAMAVGKAPPIRRTRVFVSYSHEDERWLERLRVHLKPLERDGLIDLWDDTKIAAGSLWHDEINAALDTARAAVLLVSADFLASDFIQDKELPPLLASAADDGCTVLPLLVSPSLFEETPELSRFQAVNRHGTPLTAMSDAERETTLVDLAKRIAQLVRQQP